MRCLTLTQPWATLISIGAKRIETRSWGTHYRGLIAIHAAAGFPRDCRENCFVSPFGEALRRAGIYSAEQLPLGAVVAVCRLVECKSTGTLGVPPPWLPEEGSDEWEFGDFSHGRYGWFLELLARATMPIPAKGALGLWEWEPDDETYNRAFQSSQPAPVQLALLEVA